MYDVKKEPTKAKRALFDVLKLIDLIKQNPLLYYSNSKVYKCKNATREIWSLIAEQMNKNEQECKVVWTSLRSSYTRHLQNLKRNKERKIKIKPWYLADRLSFLNEHVLQQKQYITGPYRTLENVNQTTISNDDISASFSIEYSHQNSMTDDIQSINNAEITNYNEDMYQGLTDDALPIPDSQNILSPQPQQDSNEDVINSPLATNITTNSPILTKMKMFESSLITETDETMHDEREESTKKFLHSLLFDCKKLSDKKLRLFKQDVLKNLYLYLDGDDA